MKTKAKKLNNNSILLTIKDFKKLNAYSKKLDIPKSLFLRLSLENYFKSEQYRKDMQHEADKNAVFVPNGN